MRAVSARRFRRRPEIARRECSSGRAIPARKAAGGGCAVQYGAVPGSRQAKLSRVDQPPARRLPDGLDTSVPNVARMYDYYLGGKDNFEADRMAAEEIVRLVPAIRTQAIENRKFLRLAVRYLTVEAGIDQFLDIGVGLPTQGAVHKVAHEANPEARVAYVDYDPVVVCHASALLARPDSSVAVRGDLREPAALLEDPVIRNHLDFSRPVAVILVAVLHFVSDDDDPAGIIAAIRDALAPGSYLVISHAVRGRVPDRGAVDRVHKIYDQAGQRAYPRAEAEIMGLLDGFELIRPEVMAPYARLPERGAAVSASPIGCRVLARKPLSWASGPG
jgi:SAM-dependent methyltransferase